MAADQRRKRPSAISTAGSRVHYRATRKKLELTWPGFNMRSNITLEWDEKKKTVVAKREQIGLIWKDLIPFIDSAPNCLDTLADVFSVSHEIFELENLRDVLSYEVWQTHLSEKERNFLVQFLPKGSEVHEVIPELLVGNNFHFGNPFLKWGASLCSGNLHPDAILLREKCLKTDKKAYYSELQKYHNDMISNLLILKERWASSKDLQKAVFHNTSRSVKHLERSIVIHANENQFCDMEENLAGTSESCSWATDEKACSSDNQNTVMNCEELQRRKGLMEERGDNSSDGLKVIAKPRKAEKLHKRNIQCSDGAKYMSYIKVSKEQHQRVKSSMKHSSNSIQSRSLNRVLGNLDTFHVQPFEVFVAEEQKKLHEHWLQLANRDLPAAFANWRRRLLRKRQYMKSMEQEMEEKLNSLKEYAEDDDNHSALSEMMDNGEANDEPIMTIMNKESEKSNSSPQEQMDDEVANHKSAIGSQDEEKQHLDDGLLQEQTVEAANDDPTIADESSPSSVESQHQQQIPSFDNSHELHSMDLDSDDNRVITRTDDTRQIPDLSDYPENLNHVEVVINQEDHVSSANEVWPAVSMPNSYYNSNSLNHEYASASELSLGHSQALGEQSARLIDVESHMREEQTGKDLLHRQSDDGSFFGPYPIQDRNELLQHIYKGHGGLPYHDEQKQSLLDSNRGGNMSMGTGQHRGANMAMGTDQFSPFPGQLHPSMPLEHSQKGMNDFYMHQDIQETMYSARSGYPLPRQEHLPAVNIQDWTPNSNPILTSLQSHLNGGELFSQNWFSAGHRVRDGWPGLEGAVGLNQSIQNRNSADQILFDALSRRNELHSGASYDSVGSTEHFIQSVNYAGVPAQHIMLPRAAHPLNYLSGRDTSAAPKNNNTGWMSLPHQNSGLQNPMEKPFLRSWNHQG